MVQGHHRGWFALRLAHQRGNHVERARRILFTRDWHSDVEYIGRDNGLFRVDVVSTRQRNCLGLRHRFEFIFRLTIFL